jgi:metallo-beta-lactamase family protein
VREVPGSCHLLETGLGQFLVDCGLFMGEDKEGQIKAKNLSMPHFEPKEIKAIFLTHAHIDHSGRLPLLYKKGFRGPVYCTNCTGRLSSIMLKMSQGIAEGQGAAEEPLYSKEDLNGLLGLIKPVPYDTPTQAHGLEFALLEAGHILGSAMVEVKAGGKTILFSGDMGSPGNPLLRSRHQQRQADAVLVESTYGKSAKREVSYEQFGRDIMKVISAGGSVLLPAFALHKTQLLLFVINDLKRKGIIDRDVSVYSDSATAKSVTKAYAQFQSYFNDEARKIPDPLFPKGYKDPTVEQCLKTHGKEPAIYISSSGMLDHAGAPKHLALMASDPRNAVFIVGWQSPSSLGRALLGDAKKGQNVTVAWETWKGGKLEIDSRKLRIELQVPNKKLGFSSHASGEEIAQWIHGFKQVGQIYVVHGEAASATGLAKKLCEMNLDASAPEKEGQSTWVSGDLKIPGDVPKFDAGCDDGSAPTDQ